MLLTTCQTARCLMQESGENRKRSNISCYQESCKVETAVLRPYQNITQEFEVGPLHAVNAYDEVELRLHSCSGWR
jgi:hypothetical protein